ncbi:Hint domain-containing protein [Ruegeria faecimaris]|uniref:Hint domain-containing protein n=1 Tax=Ruegeria faecimaris TaxID=686389 RepID=A0A521DYB2_9RHOB|nr:Hint domain-containing protein [Ruegeria faecimaris]SMO76709.1 Hint domain-containing protein [Ruegeria faecimaris]
MADPYFSELKYLGGPPQDFIEVAVDAGADVSGLVVTIYNSDGSIRSTNTLDGITPTTVAGRDVYVIDSASSATFTGLGKTNGISLSDGSTVYQFSSFSDPPSPGPITATAGPANGMSSTVIGEAGAGDSLISTDNGGTYTVNTTPTPGTIPCLTAGTLIATDQGPVLIESLKQGDRVLTDHGCTQPLSQIIRRHVSVRDLRRNPKLYPVRICAGALGQGLPRRDLLVSRQHRMLISSAIVKRMFERPEVLVSAIKLVELPGIYVDDRITEVTYFHLVFSEHEVIYADGAPTESLLLGDEALKSLPAAAMEELFTLFPDLVETPMQKTNYKIPVGGRQKRLIARHARNRRPLLADYDSSSIPV